MRLGRGGRGRRRFRRVPLAVMAAILAVLVVWTVHEARKPGPWQRVFATREGLTGGRLATGGIIRPGDQFVALPHPSALRRDVEIRYGARAHGRTGAGRRALERRRRLLEQRAAPGRRARPRELSHARQPRRDRPVGRHVCDAGPARQRLRRVALRPPRLHPVPAPGGGRPTRPAERAVASGVRPRSAEAARAPPPASRRATAGRSSRPPPRQADLGRQTGSRPAVAAEAGARPSRRPAAPPRSRRSTSASDKNRRSR